MQVFSTGEAIGFGWNAVKSNFGIVVGSAVITVIIQFSLNILTKLIDGQLASSLQLGPYSQFLVFAAVWTVSLPIPLFMLAGQIRIYLKIIDNIPPSFSDLFSQLKSAINLFLGALVIELVLAGVIGIYLLLAIVPIAAIIAGIIFLIAAIVFVVRVLFWQFIVLDQNVGPIRAMKISWGLTRDYGANLGNLILALAGVYLLGILALGVGLVVAIPVSVLAMMFAYRRALGASLGAAVSPNMGGGVPLPPQVAAVIPQAPSFVNPAVPRSGNYVATFSAPIPHKTNIFLVIFAVLAVLVSVGSAVYFLLVLPSFESAKTKSRDARRMADIKQLQLALEMYYNANGERYPATLSELQPTYIFSVPVDPGDPSAKTSYYYVTNNGADYRLGASLEDASNPALNSDADKTDSVINGADSAGCAREPNRYCYDIVSKPSQTQTNKGTSASNYVTPVARPMRSSMEDMFIKDQLDGLGAGTYYSAAGNTYIGLCNSTLASSMWVSKALDQAKAYNGGIAPTCNSSATAFAVASPLFDRTKFYCVDSTGFRGEITTPLGVSTVCPSR